MKMMILGASYGSLLSTKLLMAGHDVTLICRAKTAALINAEGTEVRIKLRDEETHRSFHSDDMPGRVDATTPEMADPSRYDMIALAMQEPQYSSAEVRGLMKRVAKSGKPCLSIMNMPPLAYLKRIEQLRDINLDDCYDNASVWADFDPGKVTLCSPDPQAFRPPEDKANVLHVGLPTNFKAADFDDPEDSAKLRQLADDIANVRVEGKDVPVKLRVYESLFVPMAKWSMLLTGNYRCVLPHSVQSIHDAVHGDIDQASTMYAWVDSLAQKLGASPDDMVPFEKYANAALSLMKPSSAARAIDGGVGQIERVDRLVQTIGQNLGMVNDTVDTIVNTVDTRLEENRVPVRMSKTG
jgi:hypothetical protein